MTRTLSFSGGGGGATDTLTTVLSNPGDTLQLQSDGTDFNWVGSLGAGWDMIFPYDVVVGADTGTVSALTIKGRSTGIGTGRRGGRIEWWNTTGVAAAYTFVNDAAVIGFRDTAPTSASDTGNASIDTATGNAIFGTITAGNSTFGTVGGTAGTFTSLILGDSEPVQFGAGTDFEIFHDGTDNFISSTLPDVDFQQSMIAQWDVNTDTTSLGTATGANRPGSGAKQVLSIGHTDSGGSYVETWGFYPYARPPTGAQGPMIVHYPWLAGQDIFIGARRSTGEYTGIQFDESLNSLIFYANSQIAVSTETSGIRVGGVSFAGLRTVSGQRLEIEPLAPTGDWVKVTTQGNQTGAGSTERCFVIEHNATPDIDIFSCWPGNTYSGGYMLGTEIDIPFCFDASGSTRGDTYFVYDSASSTLDLFLDGTEIWNAEGNSFNVVGGQTVAQQTVTATSATLGDDDYVVLVDDDTAGSTVTITLPAAASHTGRVYYIKKLGTTADVDVDGNASETIDGATVVTMSSQYDTLHIVCDGSNWYIV